MFISFSIGALTVEIH